MHTLTKNPVIDSQTVFDHFDNQKTYSGLTRYCDSKLVVNAFVRTLSSHVSSSEVIVNNPCPGSVATGFDKQLPAWLKPIMFVYHKVSARNVEEGSRTLVYAASVAGPETRGKFLQHNKIFE
jgi:NAD(P)-dependent dehydrogenase (short-subunit alcohol dehydrogenase family)